MTEDQFVSAVERRVEFEIRRMKDLHQLYSHPSFNAQLEDFRKNSHKIALYNELRNENDALKATYGEYALVRDKYRKLLYLSDPRGMDVRESMDGVYVKRNGVMEKTKDLKRVACRYGNIRTDKNGTRKIVIDGANVMCT
jgi:hypothetical protein